MKRNSSIRGHLKYLLWLPVYLTVYLILERRPVLTYRYTQLPIDDTIPFREEFVMFYCLWYLWIAGTGLYLLSRCRPAFRRYMTFLALAFLTGALADLILIRLDEPQFMPASNILSGLVYSSNGSEVDTVIVDGNVLMRNRRLLAVNEEEVYAACEKAAARLGMKKADFISDTLA